MQLNLITCLRQYQEHVYMGVLRIFLTSGMLALKRYRLYAFFMDPAIEIVCALTKEGGKRYPKTL